MRRFVISVAIMAAASSILSVDPAGATTNGRNGRIAFRRFLSEDRTAAAIFTVNPDGTGLQRVTQDRKGIVSKPDWSPDRRWIVFPAGAEDDTRIVKIRANGTHRMSLAETCTDGCASDGFPAWSPDGRQIAFSRLFVPSDPDDFNALFAIYVMRADGSHARRITQQGATADEPNRYRDTAPAWSPDGDLLAFERYSVSRRAHALFTVELDGSGERRITPWRLDASQPDWSPDAEWIVFRTHERSNRHGDIFVVRSNGRRLTRVVGGGGKWGSASFSPNGKQITAGHFPGSGEARAADVYVMNVDGTHLRNLTQSEAWDSAPDWGSAR